MLDDASETRRTNDYDHFNVGQLLKILSNDHKKKFRFLEKLNEESIQNKFGILFNEIYIYIYI